MPLNIDWQQILLHMFNFVLLFALLYFILYKPVRDFMRKREQAYRDRDAQSEETARQAQAQKEEYDRRLADADAALAARETEQNARVDAAVQERLRAAEEQAAAIVSAARASAAAEREQMLREAREEIAAMAGDMARRIGEQTVSDAYDAFLNRAERSGEHDEG